MLYVLPNVLDESCNPRLFLPVQTQQIVSRLDGVICESEKKARWYLKHFDLQVPLQQFSLAVLNEHVQGKKEECLKLLEPLKRGENWGLLSDAGSACIADPGSELVFLARTLGIDVQVVYGPCSITQALQLSGFSGQRFCFHGYLPRDKGARQQALRALEKSSRQHRETELFIEAPYRNNELLSDCLEVLAPQTLICTATSLDSPEMNVRVLSVSAYKKSAATVDLHKKPTLFLVRAAGE